MDIRCAPRAAGAPAAGSAAGARSADEHLPGVQHDRGGGARTSLPDLELRPAGSGHCRTSCWMEIRERLRFLNDVGLEYLTLDRLASTLSGGEAQRIQLATSLGSRLVGTLYVLDEPSIGLHSRDTAPADQDPAQSARSGKHDPGRRARSRHHASRRTAFSTWGRARAKTAGK